jgi:hypothetical protein
MKKRLIAAALAATAFASPALAQSTGTVTVDGSVADRCLFTDPADVISVGELSLPGTDGNAGRLDASKINTQSRTLIGWCNGTAATMTVEAQPLLNSDFTGTPPTGFDRRIDFSATAVANNATATDSSTAASPGAGSAVNVGMFTGNVVVTLSSATTPGGGLLVAGDYDGQVLVTLTPNVSFNVPVEE